MIGEQIPVDVFRVTKCTTEHKPWLNREVVATFFDRAGAYEYRDSVSPKNFAGNVLPLNRIGGLAVERTSYILASGKWYKKNSLAFTFGGDREVLDNVAAKWSELNPSKSCHQVPYAAQKGTPVRVLPEWEDPQVQRVYDILCSDHLPPEGEHWEGFAARKIVEALRDIAPAPAPAPAPKVEPKVEQTLFTTEARESLRKAKDVFIAEKEAAKLLGETLSPGNTVSHGSRQFLDSVAGVLYARGIEVNWTRYLHATKVNLIHISKEHRS